MIMYIKEAFDFFESDRYKMKDYGLLESIDSVEDLRALTEPQVKLLASQLRSYITEQTIANGGHLSSNLGVIELTLALHRTFNTPHDKLIWDVGHQCYAHKIVTGRRRSFDTLRKAGGLSGFTKRCESEFDPFGAGHSSTAISAAIGFATAAKLEGRNEFSIAVVGDGAFTGGIAHEGLNNIDPGLRLIIILNDNEMSISKSTGGFTRHLSDIRNSKGYHKTKSATRGFILHIPLIGNHLFKAIRSIKKYFKNHYYKSNYFEDMGLYYLGPVDGHDYTKLTNVLNAAKEYDKACIIHVKTVKGKGYEPAEAHPEAYHGILPAGQCKPKVNFSSFMGNLIADYAGRDNKICAITAAMKDGCGLSQFSKRFPNRFFDVGIAEEHAFVFAAGLAAAGEKPVFAVYSTFMQRGYDNILHDIALQRLPVITCIDRAGISCADGPTHNGIFDVAMLCQLTDVNLFAPVSFDSAALFFETALKSGLPSFIRYPNDTENTDTGKLFIYGERNCRRDFDKADKIDCFIVTYGRIVSEALRAKRTLAENNITCGIILLEQLLPLPPTARAILSSLEDALPTAPVIFVEEGILNGGLAECVYEHLRKSDIMSDRKYMIKAIESCFTSCKKGLNCFESAGISAADIVAEIINLV